MSSCRCFHFSACIWLTGGGAISCVCIFLMVAFIYELWVFWTFQFLHHVLEYVNFWNIIIWTSFLFLHFVCISLFFADSSLCSTPSLSLQPMMIKIKEVYESVCKLRKDPIRRFYLFFRLFFVFFLLNFLFCPLIFVFFSAVRRPFSGMINVIARSDKLLKLLNPTVFFVL